MSQALTSLEFLFTNGGIEVHTHTGPSVLASCVCTSRLNRGVYALMHAYVYIYIYIISLTLHDEIASRYIILSATQKYKYVLM